MGTIDLDRLIAACSDDSSETGITLRAELEPLGGPGAKVKPAVYAGGRFQLGRRWWGEGSARSVVDVITIDNEPSQANRLEAALERRREQLGLPELALDLSGLEPLPPHVPRILSSFRFPHRNADAYLRDSQLGDVDLLKTEVGRSIFDATADNADALLEYFPQALLFGFWQSHLGKRGSQAKHARCWTSEIIGIEPAAPIDAPIYTEGLKGDPINLIKEGNKVSYNPDDTREWEVVESGTKATGGRKVEDLAEVGHGQVPVSSDSRALAAVSFRTVEQQSTVSFASLRRVNCSVASAEARALLVALGLVAHEAAFGRAFHLRSGCDLRPTARRITWLGNGGDETIGLYGIEGAVELFNGTVARAEKAGLPVGSRWGEPLQLSPKKNLASVIRNTFPEPDES